MTKNMLSIRPRQSAMIMPAVFTLIIFGLACDKPSYIELDPSQMELVRRNETRRIMPRARNHQGRAFPYTEFEFESQDPNIARVDAEGVVTPVSSGQTYVTVRSSNLEAQSRVLVSFVERILIEEEEITLSVSDRMAQLPSIILLDYRGRELNGRSINFVSEDTQVARVGQRPIVGAVAPGETYIRVEADGLSARIKVTVTG